MMYVDRWLEGSNFAESEPTISFSVRFFSRFPLASSSTMLTLKLDESKKFTGKNLGENDPVALPMRANEISSINAMTK